MATTPAKRACSVCGTLLADDSPYCPVCALRQALGTQTYSVSNISSELRFEHYTVLQNAEGKPFELGRGGMGVTYKAFDVHLQRPAALKIINAQLFGNESARARFIREARAAASVRHQNVASVFHIGECAGNYYYAMEFVEGESLQSLIRRSGRQSAFQRLRRGADVPASACPTADRKIKERYGAGDCVAPGLAREGS